MVRTGLASPPPSNASLQPLSGGQSSINYDSASPLSSTLTVASGIRTAPTSVIAGNRVVGPGSNEKQTNPLSVVVVSSGDGGEDARSTTSADIGIGSVITTKKLSWYKMAFLCFVFTAGGPFGMESVVQNGGPLLALVCTVGVVLVHVFPMVLIVTELSAMMPSNRGSVEWIDRAFGHEVGFVSSMLQAVTNMVDLPVYPVLVRGYIDTMIKIPTETDKYLVGLGVLLAASVPAFLSANDQGSFAFVCMGIIISPFVVGVGYGFKDMEPSSWLRINEGTIDIATLVSVAIWLYTGFTSLGNLGGEVENPKVFLVGCGSAAILDCIMYLLPLMVTLQVQGNWDAGFFAKAFDKIIPGLGWAVLVTGALSGYAMYASSLSCYGRALWGIADKRWLPQFLTKSFKSTGAPWASMLVYISSACVLILFDFNFLVTLELIISATNYLLFYTGFIVLRYREPEAHRPWKVPGGKLAVWALVCPIIVIYFALFASCVVVWQYSVAFAGTVLLLILVYFVFVRKALKEESDQQKALLAEAEAAASLIGSPVAPQAPGEEEGESRSEGKL